METELESKVLSSKPDFATKQLCSRYISEPQFYGIQKTIHWSSYKKVANVRTTKINIKQKLSKEVCMRHYNREQTNEGQDGNPYNDHKLRPWDFYVKSG